LTPLREKPLQVWPEVAPQLPSVEVGREAVGEGAAEVLLTETEEMDG
jgi:hypothetical protein